MQRSFALIALAVMSGCASTSTETVHRTQLENAYCNPCPMPCKLGCAPAAALALAPAPKPPPAPPPPAHPAAVATFDPAGGQYTGPQTVTIASATAGAVIHYTTYGSPPTADSPVYTGPIRVEKDSKVQAIAIAPGAPASDVASASYEIVPPAPKRVEVQKERLQLNEKVLFATDRAVIDPRSHGLLDEVAMALKGHPEVKQVVIEGHTDSSGGARHNQKLSQERSESVRRYLLEQGVAPERLTAKGFGQTRPVADNKTADGREANRRVDFVIP